MKKKICLILMSLILVFASVFAESSKQLQDKKDKKSKEKDKIQEQISKSKDKIKENKKLVNKTKDEIDVLDGKIAEVGEALTKINGEIGKLNLDIEANTKELNKAQANLSEKREIFKGRIRAMYMNGDIRNLEIILSSESIEDMLTNNEMLQAIARNDKELIEFVTKQVDTIKTKEAALKRDMSVLKDRQKEQKNLKSSLETTNAQKAAYMAELEKNTDLLSAEIDKFNKQSKDLESEIRSLTSEIARKQREEQSGRSGGGPAPQLRNGKLSWPVPGHTRISSPYGYRTHPILGYTKFHSGIDIPAPAGTPIKAAADGVVITAKRMGSYGNVVMIDHGDCVTVYAHNSVLKVSVGQKVKRGDTVSLCGSTGLATGPHLHFEVRINGATQNPLSYV